VDIESPECRYGESADRFSTSGRRWRCCARL
jgi:hypothetical protein